MDHSAQTPTSVSFSIFRFYRQSPHRIPVGQPTSLPFNFVGFQQRLPLFLLVKRTPPPKKWRKLLSFLRLSLSSVTSQSCGDLKASNFPQRLTIFGFGTQGVEFPGMYGWFYLFFPSSSVSSGLSLCIYSSSLVESLSQMLSIFTEQSLSVMYNLCVCFRNFKLRATASVSDQKFFSSGTWHE